MKNISIDIERAYNKVFYLDWFNANIFVNQKYSHEIQTYKEINKNFFAFKRMLNKVGDKMYIKEYRNACKYFVPLNETFGKAFLEGLKEHIDKSGIINTPATYSEFLDALESLSLLGSMISLKGNFGIIDTLSFVYTFSGEKDIIDVYRENNPDYLQNRIHALNFLNLEDEIYNSEFIKFMQNYFPQHIKDLNPDYYVNFKE